MRRDRCRARRLSGDRMSCVPSRGRGERRRSSTRKNLALCSSALPGASGTATMRPSMHAQNASTNGSRPSTRMIVSVSGAAPIACRCPRMPSARSRSREYGTRRSFASPAMKLTPCDVAAALARAWVSVGSGSSVMTGDGYASGHVESYAMDGACAGSPAVPVRFSGPEQVPVRSVAPAWRRGCAFPPAQDARLCKRADRARRAGRRSDCGVRCWPERSAPDRSGQDRARSPDAAAPDRAK